MALLNLFDPTTGRADRRSSTRAGITDMRTGAVTAIGARAPRRAGTRRCSATSARAARRTGTCACSHSIFALRRDPRPLAPPGEPRRVRRAAARATCGATGRRHRRLGVVRARRRHRRRGVAPRAARADAEDRVDQRRARCVVPYGTMSAVELSLTDIMDKIVVDDWGQAARARSARCARTSTAAGSRRRTCTPSSARSSPALQAGPRERRRDDPVLASRPVALRHRARRGDARQGRSASASASGCASAERHVERMPIVNARMYSVTAECKADWHARPRLGAAARRPRLGDRRPRRAGAARRSSGRATTSAPR